MRYGLLPGVKVCRILSKIVPRREAWVNAETEFRDYFWHRLNDYSAIYFDRDEVTRASSRDARFESLS